MDLSRRIDKKKKKKKRKHKRKKVENAEDKIKFSYISTYFASMEWIYIGILYVIDYSKYILLIIIIFIFYYNKINN